MCNKHYNDFDNIAIKTILGPSIRFAGQIDCSDDMKIFWHDHILHVGKVQN